MKVRCVKLLDVFGRPTESSPWAKIGRVYHVLCVEAGPGHTSLRLIGEEPTPALFKPEMFEVIGTRIPPTWVIASPRPGCLSIAPDAWNAAGFWERFFDGEPEAVATFDEERAKIIAADP